MFNNVIVSGILAWLAAQIIKTVLHAVKNDKVALERLVGSGGMPSSHTATVVASMIAAGRTEGLKSSVFGLSVIVAVIVIYDAMNVRRAAGLHARELNTINRLFNFRIKEGTTGKEAIKELNEFLGHTPLEVLGGIVVGTAVALLLPVK
ncbi:MAG: divergent PAP2 family protein [Oscillospiraceae bacterium]|nr:divergent PAP2 family protein [Oscillospiraceae bacterium]MDD6082687.1 divergent PAP2 family protein [Oscillospiraceae bacterium]